MTTTNEKQSEGGNARPLYRVSFARIIGQDEDGNDRLGNAREVGAVWPRKHGKKGGLVKFDHIPVELTQHQGVLFLVPIEQDPSA